VANTIQTWNSICQEPRNELQFFWLSDRYSAIWINPPFLASIEHETQIGTSIEITTR
jgi:hypothetical protein